MKKYIVCNYGSLWIKGSRFILVVSDDDIVGGDLVQYKDEENVIDEKRRIQEFEGSKQ